MNANCFKLVDFLSRSGINEPALIPLVAALPFKLSAQGPWIAGGAVRRTLIGQPLDSDIDVFCLSEQQMALCQLAVVGAHGEKVADTKAHISYRLKVRGKDVLVQFIKLGFYPSASAVIDSFDFTACQCAFDGETLTVGEYTLWDLGRRRLAVHRVTFPVSTIRRMLKYAKQGFTVCSGGITKVIADTIADPNLQQNMDTEYVD